MKKDKFITDFEDIPTPRQKMPHLSLEERKLNFKEVELGFTEEIALKETSRCLSCRRCIGCGLCLAECDQQAIVYDQKESYTTLEVDSIVVAAGAESFDARKKPELGYRYYPDVITSMELERILNANGPFGGVLMRPSDGEIPQRIAFIQCVGSRDEDLGLNYCSNICCETTLKQAMVMMDRVAGLEITVFFSDLRPFYPNGESTYLKAKEEYGIRFLPSKVAQVMENPNTNCLKVLFSAHGQESTLEFDLVVLSTGMVATTSARRLSRLFGFKPNKFGFFPTSPQMPVANSGDQVWLAGAITHPTDLATNLAHASAVAARVRQLFRQKQLLLHDVPATPANQVEKTPGERIGLFVCQYGLATELQLDIDDVMRSLNHAHPDIFTLALEYGCNTTARQKISAAIAAEKLGRVIIAPCYSDAKHVQMFENMLLAAGLSRDRLSILSLADRQLPWDGESFKQELATLVTTSSPPPSPVAPRSPVIAEAAIIGDSLSAWQCAIDVAEQGYPVHLIFSAPEPGFQEEQLFWQCDQLAEIWQHLKQQATVHPHIQLHPGCQVQALAGDWGHFKLTLTEGSASSAIEVGAIVLALGGEPYRPQEFFYSNQPNVITQWELRQQLLDKKLTAANIVMIQCVGSRQPERPYCSQMCCEQAIRNALQIVTNFPQATIHILHRDIRVFDFAEDLYSEAQEKGIQFIRVSQPPSLQAANDRLRVSVNVAEQDQPIVIEAELIVLSNGFQPQSLTRQVASTLKIETGVGGFIDTPNRALERLQTNQPGIWVAGLSRGPQRLEMALLEATAVAGQIDLFFRNANLK